jgi:hypothetical protein
MYKIQVIYKEGEVTKIEGFEENYFEITKLANSNFIINNINYTSVMLLTIDGRTLHKSEDGLI